MTMSEEIDIKRKQVADQCRAVAHLATALAQVSEDWAKMLAAPSGADELLDMVGDRSAGHMETLGDILNGMDAIDDDDGWIDPIFEKSHEMFPQQDEMEIAIYAAADAARRDERDKTIDECAKVAGETVYAALMDHSRDIAEYVEQMIRTHQPPPSEL
jgi:hypothetical protein